MISRTANENWPGAWNMAFAIHRHRLIVRRAGECAVLRGTTFLLFCLMAAAWTAPLPPNQNSLRIFRRRRRWASDAVRYANRSIAINRYGLAG